MNKEERRWMRLMFILWFLASVLIVAAAMSGCAAMRTYSSNDERCADGCWVQEQTQFGPAWCRLEDGEKKCIPVR